MHTVNTLYFAPSVSTHASHIPAATAAALPPELPPAERRSDSCKGIWELFWGRDGFITGP